MAILIRNNLREKLMLSLKLKKETKLRYNIK